MRSAIRAILVFEAIKQLTNMAYYNAIISQLNDGVRWGVVLTGSLHVTVMKDTYLMRLPSKQVDH